MGVVSLNLPQMGIIADGDMETFEQVFNNRLALAKEALNVPIDIQEIIARGPKTAEEELRLELYDKINKLGIGAQGLGGITTVLDVKVKTYPCHAVSKATTIIPNCAATRHIDFELDGTGPAKFVPPSLDSYPDIEIGGASADIKRVNLDTITKEEIASWQIPTYEVNGNLIPNKFYPKDYPGFRGEE